MGRLGAVAVLRLEAHEPRRLEYAPRPRHPPWGRREGLGAAGNDDVGLAQGYGAHAEQDRIEAGGALAVDGQRRHAVAEPGGKADDAGGIVARGGIAEDDLLDRARLEMGVLQRRLHHGRRQALDAPALVQSTRPAEGRTTRCNDIRGSQSRGLDHGKRTC